MDTMKLEIYGDIINSLKSISDSLQRIDSKLIDMKRIENGLEDIEKAIWKIV